MSWHINSEPNRKFDVLIDYLAVLTGIVGALICRFYITERFLPSYQSDLYHYMFSYPLVIEWIVFPLMMIGLYWVTGFYADVKRKSRATVIGNTLACGIIGTLIIFFLVLLNDGLPRRVYTYRVVLEFVLWLTVLPLCERMWIAGRRGKLFRDGRWKSPTAVMGTGNKAMSLVCRIQRARGQMGFDIKYMSDIAKTNDAGNQSGLLIPFDTLCQYIREGKIKTVIVAPGQPRENIFNILPLLVENDITVYLSPDPDSPIQSTVRFKDITGEPLVNLTSPHMSPAVANFKRIFDIFVSCLALVLLSPVIAALVIAVKLDSKGPVFFKQERLGRHRKPFKIIKFRSMHTDAEDRGPALSSETDNRVTKLGRFMRKYRLDELPNFLNVLRGDMSLVGPRPERAYYAHQIMERAPQYTLLQTVRPGITSWGMVKFGYASDVDQMIERMRYDLLYIENASMGVDIKILFHTVHTVITGKGL